MNEKFFAGIIAKDDSLFELVDWCQTEKEAKGKAEGFKKRDPKAEVVYAEIKEVE